MKSAPGFKITVSENGPYLVEGGLPLANQHIVPNEEGESIEWREGKVFPAQARYSLCRCGGSATKPFCDRTHERNGFDGTETASREPYARLAERTEGPTMVVDDAQSLCAYARFCDPGGQIWHLVKKSDRPRAAQLVEHEAGHCPSGRLVARDRATDRALEPHLEPSLGLIQDPAKRVSGPIWVRGGVQIIGADGHAYEVRNRVTLCRCGASSNKPFCDGTHASIGFDDGAPREA